MDLGISIENPVPASKEDFGGADFTGLDSYFDKVFYKGAFNPDVNGVWTGRWTKTYADAIFSDEMAVSTDDLVAGSASINVYPNPVEAQFATVEFDNPNGAAHSFNLYSIDGKLVKTISEIRSNSFTFSREDLNSGIYVYELKNNGSVVGNGKLIVR